MTSTSPSPDLRMPRNPAAPTAAIVIIGEEILSGKVDEENARYAVRELRGLGVSVRRIEIVPDLEEEIADSLRVLSQRFDHVFTSGGVGPTHDDVTLPAVARAFGMTVERRPELEALIRRALGSELHERDLRMADIPAGAQLIYGDPPDPSRWPVVAVGNVYVLPGVPAIFRRKFDILRPLLQGGPIFGRFILSREGEGSIAAALDAVVAAFPSVTIGSYPQIDAATHKVRITVDGRDHAQVEAAVADLCRRLGPAVVAAGTA
jgi:molybdenum cofactor synthesis domain-containing protein